MLTRNFVLILIVTACTKNMNFIISDCLFGAVKLTMNADPDKYG